MGKLNQHIQNVLVFLICFLILSYLIPPNGVLNEDEEMYFNTAYNVVNQNIDFNSAFILNDSELNHRFLYDVIFGYCIDFFGYELTHILGRLFLIIVFSLSIMFLSKLFETKFIEVSFILLFFLFLNQTFYSGLQLFKGCLASDFAYSLVLFSIGFMFQGRYLISFVFIFLATYFHFLIGGYSFLFFIIYYFIKNNNLVFSFSYSFIYILLIAPLIFILISSNLESNPPNLSYDVNWIYSYIRHPHHLLPFKSYDEFIISWMPGIICSLILFVIIFFIYHQKYFVRYSNLSLFLIIGYFYLFSAFVISYFDTSLILSKLYLFRPAAIVLFLTLFYFIRFIVIKFRFKSFLDSTSLQIFCFFTILFFFFYAFKNSSRFNKLSNSKNKTEFLDYIKTNTNDEDVFLFEYSMLDFERKTGRSSFFSNKLIPTHNLGIIEWYKRRLFYQNIFSETILVNHNINYFVTNKKTNNSNFDKIFFENSDFVVYTSLSK